MLKSLAEYVRKSKPKYQLSFCDKLHQDQIKAGFRSKYIKHFKFW